MCAKALLAVIENRRIALRKATLPIMVYFHSNFSTKKLLKIVERSTNALRMLVYSTSIPQIILTQ
jgi:hypothetical protein